MEIDVHHELSQSLGTLMIAFQGLEAVTNNLLNHVVVGPGDPPDLLQLKVVMSITCELSFGRTVAALSSTLKLKLVNSDDLLAETEELVSQMSACEAIRNRYVHSIYSGTTRYKFTAKQKKGLKGTTEPGAQSGIEDGFKKILNTAWDILVLSKTLAEHGHVNNAADLITRTGIRKQSLREELLNITSVTDSLPNQN